MKMLLPQSEIQVTLILVHERCTTLVKEKLVLFHSSHSLCLIPPIPFAPFYLHSLSISYASLFQFQKQHAIKAHPN